MRRIQVDFSFPWPFAPEETGDVLAWIFQVALVGYLGLSLIESGQPGFVRLYFNLNAWLYSTIAIGALASIWPMAVPEARRIHRHLDWKNLLWLLLIALVGVVIVWTKIGTKDWLSSVIAVLSGAIVFGLGLLIYINDDAREGE